jgi:hypothetical protein
MNAQRAQAERMRFLFILNPNTFATDVCGYPLRSSAIALCALHLVLGLLITCLFFKNSPYDWYFAILPLFWLVMIIGPITRDVGFCVVFAILLMLAIIFLTYAFLQICAFLSPVPEILVPITIYLILWYIAGFVYFSYTKSIALGLPTELNQNSSQCMSFIQPNDSNCQVPATSLRVEQSPTIALTNPVDLVFVNDKQGLVVDNVTLPSGLVVPSGGHGKNWKVVGSLITLV